MTETEAVLVFELVEVIWSGEDASTPILTEPSLSSWPRSPPESTGVVNMIDDSESTGDEESTSADNAASVPDRGEPEEATSISDGARSEERRVGKECRSRWSP